MENSAVIYDEVASFTKEDYERILNCSTRLPLGSRMTTVSWTNAADFDDLTHKEEELAEEEEEEEEDDEEDDDDDDDEFDDDGEDDGDDEPEVEETPDGESRAERRAARGRKHREALEAAAERDFYKKQYEEQQRQISQFQYQQQLANFQHQQHAAQGQSPQDQYQQQIDEAWERMNEYRAGVASRWANMTPEERTAADKRQRGMFSDIQRLEFDRNASRLQPRQQQNPVTAILVSEFPDVINHPNAGVWARARESQLNSEGSFGVEAARQALEESRKRFGTRPQQRPAQRRTAGLRSTLSGRGAGGAATSGESGGPKWTKSHQEAAQRVYPELSPKEAKKRFLRMNKKAEEEKRA